ncbi:MAG: repressor LexA [Acidiferrobacteraceae bacterium]|nr:repressor LexA [Acidiferrobacteraceae bacterium]|tara:strand:+ start:285 stop:890 length:606 start_codon:yes stop_codon:yes gene_type:complete
MPEKLTKRQFQIFEYIQKTIEHSGIPPTRSEIASHFGFRSINAAEDHLRALARKGAINLQPDTSRGIQLLHKTGIPVIGEVSAGHPILATQNIEEHYPLPASLFKPRANYLLRVRGMSMRDIGILHDDLLAVHKAQEASNGQIIVARLGDDVTVKQFRQRGNIVTLLAKNPEFDAIRVDLRQQEFVIEGIGVGVIRNGKLL